jgi:anti-anti-sigma factor
MRIEEDRVGGVTILSVAGTIDASTLPAASAKLDALFGESRTCIVFNLSGLEVVTSTVIGFLVDATRRAQALGGDLVVSTPSRLFRSSVDMLGAGDEFTLAPNNEEALAHLRAREAE